MSAHLRALTLPPACAPLAPHFRLQARTSGLWLPLASGPYHSSVRLFGSALRFDSSAPQLLAVSLALSGDARFVASPPLPLRLPQFRAMSTSTPSLFASTSATSPFCLLKSAFVISLPCSTSRPRSLTTLPADVVDLTASALHGLQPCRLCPLNGFMAQQLHLFMLLLVWPLQPLQPLRLFCSCDTSGPGCLLLVFHQLLRTRPAHFWSSACLLSSFSSLLLGCALHLVLV